MKFLKINAKVLLILCLFSGILFLSTGCGDDNNSEPMSNDSNEVNNNNQDDNESNSNIGDGQDSTDDDSTSNGNGLASNNSSVDYSVWVANTTINTDKDQRSYTVIWGDTLWLISTAWEVSYQEIAEFNNIPNPDLIYVDQVIYNPLFK